MLSGRNIGYEYRYVLERKYAKKYSGNMLERPSLLLNPWSLRKTDTGTDLAKAGEVWSDNKEDQISMLKRRSGSGGRSLNGKRKSRGIDNFASLDFLPSVSLVLANAKPDAKGQISIKLADIGARQQLHVLVVDNQGSLYREFTVPAGRRS